MSNMVQNYDSSNTAFFVLRDAAGNDTNFLRLQEKSNV